MPYTRPYAGGFQDFPATTTPIDASALNTMDVGIKTANDQFQTVTTAQRATLTPSVGQAVWDSDLKQLMVFMNASGGNAWQPVGNRIVCASTTRPSSPFEGQEIYETDTQKTLVYNGTSWFEVGDLDNTGGLSDAGLAQTVRVFANEAARDAAITSPSEGMHVYLTAPTVPAATGATSTSVPTGITTIYNGTVWVCVTEVGAAAASSSQTLTTSAADLAVSGTNTSVTLVTGTTALVMMAARATLASNFCTLNVKTGTTAATAAGATTPGTTGYGVAAKTFVMTGLTAGTNTFTLQGLANVAGGSFDQHTLVVKGIA